MPFGSCAGRSCSSGALQRAVRALPSDAVDPVPRRLQTRCDSRPSNHLCPVPRDASRRARRVHVTCPHPATARLLRRTAPIPATRCPCDPAVRSPARRSSDFRTCVRSSPRSPFPHPHPQCLQTRIHGFRPCRGSLQSNSVVPGRKPQMLSVSPSPKRRTVNYG